MQVLQYVCVQDMDLSLDGRYEEVVLLIREEGQGLPGGLPRVLVLDSTLRLGKLVGKVWLDALETTQRAAVTTGDKEEDTYASVQCNVIHGGT